VLVDLASEHRDCETKFLGFENRVKKWPGAIFVKRAESPVLMCKTFPTRRDFRNSEIRVDLTWPIDPTPPFECCRHPRFRPMTWSVRRNVNRAIGRLHFFIDPSESVSWSRSRQTIFLAAPGSRVIDSCDQ